MNGFSQRVAGMPHPHGAVKRRYSDEELFARIRQPRAECAPCAAPLSRKELGCADLPEAEARVWCTSDNIDLDQGDEQ